MEKRTPQEIADFFQGYVAKDMSGCWSICSNTPYIDDTYDQWFDEERAFDYIPFRLISDTDNIYWKESLCEPYMIASEVHRIAEHYGKRELLDRLIIECAEVSVSTINYQKNANSDEFFIDDIARLELLLEQIKYIMKIDPVKLGGAKKESIAIQQLIIAEGSHAESAENPRIVRGKSENEEE